MTSKTLEDKLNEVLSSENPLAQKEELRRLIDREVNQNPVTGMPDGRQMNQDLEEIQEKRRNGYNDRTYVAMIDIDDFGKFNKDHGHEVGDEVLKAVNRIIRDTLRDDDQYFYHLHGEEMVAIYNCRNQVDALTVADRICNEVAEKSKDKVGYQVTISLGVTEFIPDVEIHRVAQNRSDRYMRMAKNAGKNQIYCGDGDNRLQMIEWVHKPGIAEGMVSYLEKGIKGAKSLLGKGLTRLYHKSKKD